MESFNGKLRDGLLARETLYTLTEARILIERWRRQYNTVRPHSALGYRRPRLRLCDPCRLKGPGLAGLSHKKWIVNRGQVTSPRAPALSAPPLPYLR